MAETRIIRKKGFSFLSFLLGILFGIILLLGAIGGAVAVVLYADLDTIFNTVNVPNKDEDGNYIIINTDKNSGGVANGMELIQTLMSYVTDINNKSVEEVESLIPATKQLVDSVYAMVNEFVEVDKNVILAKKFSEFPNYVNELLMGMKPATLLDKFNVNMGDGMVGMLVDALVYGSEASYVTVGGAAYPVWYEERNVSAFSARSADDDYIYFYNLGENSYVVEKTESGYAPTAALHQGGGNAKLTGNYYYENADDSGEKIIVTPITVGYFTSNSNLSESLNGLYIGELLGMNDGFVYDIIGDITVGDIVGGNVDFDEKINGIQIASLIDIDPESSILSYLGYGLSDVAAVSGEAYNYTGTIDGDKVYVTSENGKITGVYSDSRLTVEVEGTTVKNIGERIDGINVAVFMDIKPDDSILMYLGYGVTNVNPDGDNYVGSYKLANGEEVTCYIEMTGESISGIYYLDGQTRVEIPATGVGEVGDRIGDLTTELKIKDIVDITPGEDKIMDKLGEYTVANISDAINDFTMSDFMEDIAPTDNLMLYLIYGVTDVQAFPEGGAQFPYKGVVTDADGGKTVVYIAVDDGTVTGVYKDTAEQVAVEGTKIKDASDRISGITKDLKIRDVITITAGDKFMEKLGEYTIANVGNAINELTLDDFIEVELKTDGEGNAYKSLTTDSALMAYIVYGLTDINIDAGKAVYHFTDKTPAEEAVLTLSLKEGSADTYLIEAVTVGGQEITATGVKSVDSRISGVTEDLKIGQLIDVTGNKILESMSDSTISSLGNDIGSLTINELYADEIYKRVERLEVVNGEPRIVDTFEEGLIYYVKDGDEYVLASSTGTLEEFEDGKTYYTYGEGKIGFNAAYLYFVKDGDKYVLANDEGTGKLDKLEDGKTYYTYGVPNALWKMLLYENKSESGYTVNNITGMVDNVRKNVEKSTLRELHEAGILTFSENENGEVEVFDKYLPTDTSKKFGDYLLTEAIEALANTATSKSVDSES